MTAVRAPMFRSLSRPSRVLGVHGAEGETGWKALFTRRHLASPTEAVECAMLPPGAVSGEHLHSRTEELYLILAGTGDFYLDGVPTRVGPGFMAVTTPGHTHGLVNTGNEQLNWWVVETITSSTQDALSVTPRSEVVMKTTPSPMDATPVQTADLKTCPRVVSPGFFTGPLQAVERHHLVPEKAVSLGGYGHETAVFLNAGYGYVNQPDGQSYLLNSPASILVPAGQSEVFTAVGESELYVVELKVNQE